MYIAITGSSGLIGKGLVKRVLEAGHKVLGLDVIAGDEASNLETRLIDLTDYDAILESLKGCEAVIHCAAIPNPETLPNWKVHNTNVCASYNVLRAAAELKITRVVQLSSINVLGATYHPFKRDFQNLPLIEEEPCTPADPYALSKQICEMQADSMVRAYPFMRIASLRPHMCLYDIPDASFDFVRFKTDPDPEALVNQNQLWAWNLVDDIARAALLGITSEGWSGHEAFFIIAPTSPHYKIYGDDAPSMKKLAQKCHPEAKLREGWFEGPFGEHRTLYDTGKAERLLWWKHGHL